jgi:hypothetical protein
MLIPAGRRTEAPPVRCHSHLTIATLMLDIETEWTLNA